MEGEAHSYRKLITLIMASVSIKRPRPCQNDNDDDSETPNFVFSGNDTFSRFLVIQSQDGSDPVTSLSPFIIEKQIESLIGTPKSVKKLKQNVTGGNKQEVTNGKPSQNKIFFQSQS